MPGTSRTGRLLDPLMLLIIGSLIFDAAYLSAGRWWVRQGRLPRSGKVLAKFPQLARSPAGMIAYLARISHNTLKMIYIQQYYMGSGSGRGRPLSS